MRFALSLFCFFAVAVMSLGQTKSVFLPRVLDHEATTLQDGEIVISVDENGTPTGLKVGADGIVGGFDLIDRRNTFGSTPSVILDPTDYTISLGGTAYRSGKTYQMFPSTTNLNAAVGTLTVTPNRPYQVKSVSIVSQGYFYTASNTYASDRTYFTFTASKIPLTTAYWKTCEVTAVSVQAWVYPNAGRTNDCTETPTLIAHPFGVNSAYSDLRYNLPLTWGGYKTIVGDDVADWSRYDASNRVAVHRGMRFEDGISQQQKFDVESRNNGFLTITYRDSIGSNQTVLAADNLDCYPCIVNLPDSNTTEIIWTTNGIVGGTYVIEATTNYPNGWIAATELRTNTPPDGGYLSRTVVNPFGAETYWPTYWRVHNADATVGTPVLRTTLPFDAPSYKLAGNAVSFTTNYVVRVGDTLHITNGWIMGITIGP